MSTAAIKQLLHKTFPKAKTFTRQCKLTLNSGSIFRAFEVDNTARDFVVVLEDKNGQYRIIANNPAGPFSYTLSATMTKLYTNDLEQALLDTMNLHRDELEIAILCEALERVGKVDAKAVSDINDMYNAQTRDIEKDIDPVTGEGSVYLCPKNMGDILGESCFKMVADKYKQDVICEIVTD